MNEEYLFENSFSRILDGNVDFYCVSEFFESTDFKSVEIEYESLTPIDFVLKYGDPDIVLTKSEKSFIRYIYTCFSVLTEDDARIFIVELNLRNKEPFFECAAIIKIFNLLFNDKENLFLFVADHSIALGCKRTYSQNAKNNFCVSNFYDNSLLDDAYDFFNYGCDCAQETADNIMFSSKIERIYSTYDDNHYNPQYNETLKDVIDSLSYECEENEESNIIYYEIEPSTDTDLNYVSISRELKDIGEFRESKSAFEFLQESETVSVDDRVFYKFANEDFSEDENSNTDAEELLKEIMGENK